MMGVKFFGRYFFSCRYEFFADFSLLSFTKFTSDWCETLIYNGFILD